MAAHALERAGCTAGSKTGLRYTVLNATANKKGKAVKCCVATCTHSGPSTTQRLLDAHGVTHLLVTPCRPLTPHPPAMTPSGVPPMPSIMSTGPAALATSMAPATSPSEMSRMRAPASRHCDGEGGTEGQQN